MLIQIFYEVLGLNQEILKYRRVIGMALPVFRQENQSQESCNPLEINAKLAVQWLVRFLVDECKNRRGVDHAILGLSGGVDSAVVAYLCARAFGPQNVHAIRMPYKKSSQESLDHADLVAHDLGLSVTTIPITAMVDGYLSSIEPEISGQRLGNVCARCRMIVLFDQASKLNGLPIGTGNKSERLFGYFTWHADDSPPINPLGDLFKTQVWDIARELGVPSEIVNKAPTADLVEGQTDEGDFGISYADADQILHYMTSGYPKDKIIALGFSPEQVALVWKRVSSTHWKRRLPTTAMMSYSAIGEYYLRPVDY